MKKYWARAPFFNRNILMSAGLGVAVIILSSYKLHKTKPVADPPAITVKVQQLADGLHAPTAVAFPSNGTIWVTEQTGKIRLIKNGKMSDADVFDLHSKLINIDGSYDERGLLDIALSPKFSVNHKFYVYYSAPPKAPKSDNLGVLAEYKMLPNSDQADPNSGRIVFTVDEPESNHNGVCIVFGPDGYLYLSLGDGGGQGDKHGDFGNGQNLNTLLGKILRINVNAASGYKVPADNPFVGKAGTKPEIWAYGFRNPWKYSFDSASKKLFAGDVGQDSWEEVDIVNKGANYGWRLMEGTHCYNPASGCPVKGITMPITEYSHKVGISIIGGYVYNGQQIPALKSKYVFGDWTGPVFYLQQAGNAWVRGKVSISNYPENFKITSLGEDPTGELYILTNPDTGPGNTKGVLYKIVKN